MSVNATHYVVFGVVITDEIQVNDFFKIEESHLDFMEDYHDNPYDPKIIPNKSGINVIADGMNGEYVVVGKILAKSNTGLELIELNPEILDIKDNYLELDETLGTNFRNLNFKYIVFTHWH